MTDVWLALLAFNPGPSLFDSSGKYRESERSNSSVTTVRSSIKGGYRVSFSLEDRMAKNFPFSSGFLETERERTLPSREKREKFVRMVYMLA